MDVGFGHELTIAWTALRDANEDRGIVLAHTCLVKPGVRMEWVPLVISRGKRRHGWT